MKDDGYQIIVNHVKANPTMLSSLNLVPRDVTRKILNIYRIVKTEDTEALGRQRAKPSKIKA